ncbi:MAG: hypothetical protein A2Y62_00960 [Candidatus Fischerbacteria bacterium RBG_13_37_8]|uniref:SLH domain-containing protein n=1 Tax=Candidatus Fischerbacteria bacterium RBG_13_37_8 TaxID=1817863 RepID=A0A1F5VWB8_9BACT|nr:MAG: hypothetical protein A2Y62_00960 [Candidatus Fischerbacteria bacterium RBG_13_37_8]
MFSYKPIVDDSSSNIPNGIIEEDETVNLVGTLENLGSASATSVTGVLTSSDPVTINNANAVYPDIMPGSKQNSTISYSITPYAINRTATHWDFTVTESPSCMECSTISYNFTYHVGNSFVDVPTSDIFYSSIETLLHSEITGGCDAENYCPSYDSLREQMAKFICKSMEQLNPGSCSATSCQEIFTDVPFSNIFCSYIETLYDAGITGGCQTYPLLYCPNIPVQREGMAKFICLAMESVNPGSCPTAPSCAGIFNDVPASNPFCIFIEALYEAGVISGCQSMPLLYCPDYDITRAQMAKFLVNGFGFNL